MVLAPRRSHRASLHPAGSEPVAEGGGANDCGKVGDLVGHVSAVLLDKRRDRRLESCITERSVLCTFGASRPSRVPLRGDIAARSHPGCHLEQRPTQCRVGMRTRLSYKNSSSPPPRSTGPSRRNTTERAWGYNAQVSRPELRLRAGDEEGGLVALRVGTPSSPNTSGEHMMV